MFAQHHGNDDSGFEEEALAGATGPPPVYRVGILGCRCDACLNEGEEHELDHERRERVQHERWRWLGREEQLPPRYDKPPPPYNDQPPPRYNEALSRPEILPPPPATASAAAARGVEQGGAARGPSKSWPSPEDWDREDGLGGKGSRSYSPGSAESSPLYEACETYDDEGSYFFDS